MALARGPRLLLELLLLAAGLGCVTLLALRPVFAVDLHWLLALGREIARRGSIPTTDLFSAVDPEAPWVQFQWLWELGAYGLHTCAGLRGLRIAQAVLLTLAFLGLYVLGRRRGHGPGLAALVTGAALLLFVDRFRLRPDALNFVLLVPLLPVFAGRYRTLSPLGRVGIGGWCFLWASLHGGGVLLPLAALACLTLGAALGGRLGLRASGPGEQRVAAWSLVAGVLGAAACPTTVPGLAHFFAIYGEMSAGSPEWSATALAPFQRLHAATVLIACAPLASVLIYGLHVRVQVRRVGPRSVDLGQLLLCGLCLLLAVFVLRLVFLAIVPLWLVCDARATARKGACDGRVQGVSLSAALGLLAIVLHYAALGPWGSPATALWATGRLDLEPGAFPQEVVAFVAEAGIRGKVMNDRVSGGPLVFHAYPQVRVLADSRHNFDEATWHLVRGVESETHQAEAVDAGFTQHGLELALLRAPIARPRPLSVSWQLLYRAGRTELYQHLAGEHADHNLRATAAFLQREGIVPGEQNGTTLAELATLAGRRRYLENPYRQRQRLRIDELMASGPPDKRAVAARVLARELLDVRDLRAAEQLLLHDARDVRSPRMELYRAELAQAQQRFEAALKHVRTALAGAAALPPRERRAASVLESRATAAQPATR